MSQFEIGTRVRGLGDWDGTDLREENGTIISIADGKYHLVCVEWDNDIGGHDEDGAGEAGHCWWCSTEILELLNENAFMYSKNSIISRSQKLWNKSKYGKNHSFLVQTT